MHSLTLVESDLRKRIDTDQKMSFGNYLLWYIILAFITLGIGSIVVAFIINFRLVDRRNKHFERQISLNHNVIRCLRELIEEKNKPELTGDIDRLKLMVNDAASREAPKEPWLWAVVLPVITLGIAGLYTLYFLTKDFRDHSVRQREISDTLTEIFRKAGARAGAIVDEGMLPDRNYWTYLALSLLTLGIFAIYWQYLLFTDPNRHFEKQAFTEDQVVSVLRALA